MLPVAHANVSNLSRRNAAMFEPAETPSLFLAALLGIFPPYRIEMLSLSG